MDVCRRFQVETRAATDSVTSFNRPPCFFQTVKRLGDHTPWQGCTGLPCGIARFDLKGHGRARPWAPRKPRQGRWIRAPAGHQNQSATFRGGPHRGKIPRCYAKYRTNHADCALSMAAKAAIRAIFMPRHYRTWRASDEPARANPPLHHLVSHRIIGCRLAANASHHGARARSPPRDGPGRPRCKGCL